MANIALARSTPRSPRPMQLAFPETCVVIRHEGDDLSSMHLHFKDDVEARSPLSFSLSLSVSHLLPLPLPLVFSSSSRSSCSTKNSFSVGNFF